MAVPPGSSLFPPGALSGRFFSQPLVISSPRSLSSGPTGRCSSASSSSSAFASGSTSRRRTWPDLTSPPTPPGTASPFWVRAAHWRWWGQQSDVAAGVRGVSRVGGSPTPAPGREGETHPGNAQVVASIFGIAGAVRTVRSRASAWHHPGPGDAVRPHGAEHVMGKGSVPVHGRDRRMEGGLGQEKWCGKCCGRDFSKVLIFHIW